MKVGIVLSGGMAKGAYQIGALKALKEVIPLESIKCISCASVGVLNGYAFATGKLELAEKLWYDLCKEHEHLSLGKILKTDIVNGIVQSLYQENDSLFCSMYSSLLDIKSKTLVYKDLSTLEQSALPEYLRASVSLPIYNKAVCIDEQQYYDGAMVDNIPVFPLMDADLDYIVCVYFDDCCYKFETSSLDSKVIKVVFPGESLLKESVIFEKETVASMVQEGYSYTARLLSDVFDCGCENLNHIYEKIDERNRQMDNGKTRITGDVVVSNLNRVAKKFTKRKIYGFDKFDVSEFNCCRCCRRPYRIGDMFCGYCGKELIKQEELPLDQEEIKFLSQIRKLIKLDKVLWILNAVATGGIAIFLMLFYLLGLLVVPVTIVSVFCAVIANESIKKLNNSAEEALRRYNSSGLTVFYGLFNPLDLLVFCIIFFKLRHKRKMIHRIILKQKLCNNK